MKNNISETKVRRATLFYIFASLICKPGFSRVLVCLASCSDTLQVASGKLSCTLVRKMNERGKKCLSIEIKTVFTSWTTEMNSGMLRLLLENYSPAILRY